MKKIDGQIYLTRKEADTLLRIFFDSLPDSKGKEYYGKSLHEMYLKSYVLGHPDEYFSPSDMEGHKSYILSGVDVANEENFTGYATEYGLLDEDDL